MSMASMENVINNLIDVAEKSSARVAETAGGTAPDVAGADRYLVTTERAIVALKMIADTGLKIPERSFGRRGF
jgi:hypothetical protein